MTLQYGLFTYRACVVSIYDGDTIRADIDLGFNQRSMTVKLRLAALDAPEIRGIERVDGILSQKWLESQIPPGTWIVLKTIRDRTEKYGRYLALIQMVDGTILNETMVAEGFAKPYMEERN